MTDGSTVYRAGWRDGLRPDPRLTVSEWADRYRELSQQSSSEAWHWQTDRTPYFREVMDALSPSSPVETVVLQKGSQLGGTEAGNNWLGYVIHQAPGPMLYVQPTVEMVKRTSKQRIAHMIESCPPLRERVKETRSRDSGNTILAKEFPGGILVMTGANSAVGLRSIPVRYLFMDEIDAFEADAEGEGDPVELARRRTSNFRRNRKMLLVSTPTLKGFSRIERAFLQTDQRYSQVPYPFCEVLQRITWAAIEWPECEPQKAALKCVACERLIPEARKTEMLAAGEWVPTAEGDGRTVGYHLSALYSPFGWYSWGDAAADHMKAKEAGREALKVWINTVLAETWEEEGDAIDVHQPKERLGMRLRDAHAGERTAEETGGDHSLREAGPAQRVYLLDCSARVRSACCLDRLPHDPIDLPLPRRGPEQRAVDAHSVDPRASTDRSDHGVDRCRGVTDATEVNDRERASRTLDDRPAELLVTAGVEAYESHPTSPLSCCFRLA